MFLHVSVILSGGRHPPGRHPQTETPLGRHPPLGMATATDGTHPTGMHSCYLKRFDVGELTQPVS